MMEHLVPVFHTTSIPIDGSCSEEEEQPKRERAQKAQDHYRELLGDYYPKLTSLKLNPNAKSKTIMYFDVGTEC